MSPLPPKLNPVWPAKISFFGACTGDSLILLVSATLVRAKISPWVSSVEGRRVPSHGSKAFHGSTLAEAVWRWWWSLGTRISAEDIEEKQGRTRTVKSHLSWLKFYQDSTITADLTANLHPTKNIPTIPKLDWQDHCRTKSFSPKNLHSGILGLCAPQTRALLWAGKPSEFTFPFLASSPPLISICRSHALNLSCFAVTTI